MQSIKKAWKFVRKNWITFWMLVSVIIAVCFVAYARYYENTNVTKRVVATQKGEKSMFSSILLSTSMPQQIRTVGADEASAQYFDISIYDYDFKNPGSEYRTDIDYDLTVTFYNGTGTQALTSEQIGALIGTDAVSLYGFSGASIEANPFLTVDKDTAEADRTYHRTVTKAQKVDSFRLYLPISMKDKDISVKVVASPDGYNDLPESIGAVFLIKAQSFVTISGWHGEFNDDKSIPLSQYDGFNYIIIGNGKSEGNLIWDSTLVEPNMQQVNAIKKEGAIITSSGDIKSITLSLDSADNGGRYVIQFYVMNYGSGSGRASIDSLNWSQFADSNTGAVRFVETTP
ncbi:MAG: hypothetical protein IJU20_02135 [Clostridia bacterium]|nr:hypothetical protein [Clostridia bacterium]